MLIENRKPRTRIEVRLTEKQKEQIDRAAKRCGITASEYLRQRALDSEPKAVLPDAFFVCCERLDRLCHPPFSKETNDQALDLLRQMHSILTDGWDGPPEPESKESIDTLESTVEEPKPRKRLFGLRR